MCGPGYRLTAREEETTTVGLRSCSLPSLILSSPCALLLTIRSRTWTSVSESPYFPRFLYLIFPWYHVRRRFTTWNGGGNQGQGNQSSMLSHLVSYHGHAFPSPTTTPCGVADTDTARPRAIAAILVLASLSWLVPTPYIPESDLPTKTGFG